MSLKAVRVPAPMQAPFELAERYVEGLFAQMERQPEQGAVRVGGERYVLMRCESLYLSWFDALNETFGEETARAFVSRTRARVPCAW